VESVVFELQSKSVMRVAAVGLACLAAPVVAQDRTALVIANSAYPGDAALGDVRKTALDVSETLLGLGFAVNRLENPSGADMQTALSTLQNADGISLLYYAGRTEATGDDSFLLPVSGNAGIPIDPLVTGASDAPRFVFIDMCHDIELAEPEGVDDEDFLEGEGDDPNEAVPLAAAMARSIDATENLFFAASVEPGEGCEVVGNQTLTDLLLDRMTVPGLTAEQFIPVAQADAVDEVDEAIWFGSTLADPFVFRTATSDVRLTAEDYAMLETLSPNARDQMLRLWASAGIAVDIAGASAVTATPLAPVVASNQTIVLVAPVRPVNATTIISPISPRASTGTSGTTIQPSGGGGVTLVAGSTPAPAPAVFRATPGENGLPAPSILVGFVTDGVDGAEIVEEPVSAAPEVADSPVAGSGLGYENLEARNEMRASDPDLFASLVETGAFDPPTAELARAIQTELARMNCYRSTIDGIWGPGSRRSVAGYYSQVGGTTPSQDPDPRIFRAIITSEDVRCPDPAPAPRAAATTRRTTTTQAAPRRTTTTQAAPRVATPAPAAPAAPARRTISQSSGTGAFR
jgi:hypothetical protein